MEHNILRGKIYLTKMFIVLSRKLIKPYIEYEDRAAEFKRYVEHYHLKPEVEAAIIARARERAISTPFSFPDLLLDEIHQLINKNIIE